MSANLLRLLEISDTTWFTSDPEEGLERAFKTEEAPKPMGGMGELEAEETM